MFSFKIDLTIVINQTYLVRDLQIILIIENYSVNLLSNILERPYFKDLSGC